MARKTYISASKLKRFRKCPYQCKHEPFTRNAAVDFGNAVHAGLASMLAGGDALKAYKVEAGKIGVSLDKEEDAKECIEFAKGMNHDLDSIITIESADGEASYYNKKFFEVDIAKTWGFRGGMDVVWVDDEGNLVIDDWKTGNSKEEDDLQLLIYAIVAWKKYGQFPSIKTRFIYLQQNFVDYKTWDSRTLANSLDYVIPLVEEYLKAEKENNWPKTPHTWCKYCSLKDGCEAFQKQLIAKPDRASYDIPATVENIEAIIEYKDKIKAIANAAYSIEKMMEDKLKEVIGDKTIQLNGRDFFYKEKVSRYDYDLPKIFTGVQEVIGRAPIELCDFASSGLKELNKTLDKDQKKAVKKIVEENREVKSKSKTLKIEISKEAAPQIEEKPAIQEASKSLPAPTGEPTTTELINRNYHVCLECGVVSQFTDDQPTKCRGCKVVHYHITSDIKEANDLSVKVSQEDQKAA